MTVAVGVPVGVRRDRRGQRHEHPLLPDPVEEPRRHQVCAQVLLDPSQREDDAPALELGVHLVERVDRGQVDLDVGLHVHDQPFDRAVGQVERGQGAALEVGSVGEEQWRVVPVDDQARHLARGRVVVDVVHPGDARGIAQYPVVRTSHPP